jgi:flagellar hook-length control protein FliK
MELPPVDARIETPTATKTQEPVQPVKVDQPRQASSHETEQPQTFETPETPAKTEHTSDKQSEPEIRHSQRIETTVSVAPAPMQQAVAPEIASITSSKSESTEPRRIEPVREKAVAPEAAIAPPSTVPAVAASPQNQTESREGQKQNSPDVEIHVQARTRDVRDTDVPLKSSVESEPKPAAKIIEVHDPVASLVVPRETRHHAIDSPAPVETTESTQAAQWTQIEKSTVVNELIEKARSIRWDKNSEIVVSLKPESLGRISMRASLVDRTMVATIAAESDKVRQILQLELPVIQRSLQESGIVARVEVSHQSDLNLSHNNPSHGQPRFRPNDALPFEEDAVSHNPAATVEVADARYSTHSVHLIA